MPSLIPNKKSFWFRHSIALFNVSDAQILIFILDLSDYPEHHCRCYYRHSTTKSFYTILHQRQQMKKPRNDSGKKDPSFASRNENQNVSFLSVQLFQCLTTPLTLTTCTSSNIITTDEQLVDFNQLLQDSLKKWYGSPSKTRVLTRHIVVSKL
jgi:hypothetical protein